ncbi:MAG: SMC family ATPase [Euryarchaeota archaeon]|nr:SMC family ATPase [Euryarchaeota archaeon]
MRLRRIRLVNYRRFADATLDFPDGLIGVVGRNGAGKSTLLEAILWSLYGHDAARTGKELLKREGAAPGEDLVVRLEFELDGSGYAITRRLKGKSLAPEAAVECAGQLLVAPGPNSWEQANQYVERLVGFDRAAFESTVVAKQGELAALSDLRPAERKRLLLGMLGIGRIDETLQRVRSDARLLEARLQEARRSLEAEPGLRAELEEAKKEESEAASRLRALAVELDRLRVDWGAARTVSETLRRDRERDLESRGRLASLQSRLEALWGQRTRLSADMNLIRDREADAQRLRGELGALGDVDAAIAASDAAARTLERRRSLEDRIGSLAKEKDRWAPLTDAHAVNGSSPATLEESVRRGRAALEEDAARGARIQAELEAAALERQRLDEPPHAHLDPKAPCPACGRPLGASAREAATRREKDRRERQASLEGRSASLRDELSTVLQRHSALQTECSAAQAALEAVRQRIHRAALASDEVARIAAETTALESTLASLPDIEWEETAHARLVDKRRVRDGLRDALARCEEQAARLPRLRDEDRVLQGQEQAVVAEREATSREVRAVAYAPGSWERAHEQAEGLRQRLETGERERVQLTERQASRAREVRRLGGQLAEIAARRKDAQTGAARLELLDVLGGRRADQGLLAEFRNHLVGRIRPALGRHASALVRQMTRGRYTEIVLDEDYAPSLVDQGLSHPLERFSGGEVDVANLALRLAVSELVTNGRGRSRLQVVALDEVFGAQDEERRGAVIDSLHALAHVFRQVLVVTHLEDVRERLEHVVRVTEDEAREPRFVTSWQAKA